MTSDEFGSDNLQTIWICAPVHRTGQEIAVSRERIEAWPDELEDSSSDAVQWLGQEWASADDIRVPNVVDCYLVASAGVDYLCATIAVFDHPGSRHGMDAQLEWERVCKAAADLLAEEILGADARVLWVNRTLISRPRAGVPPTWVGDDARTAPFRIVRTGEQHGVARVSWGNNIVPDSVWSDRFSRNAYMRAMVDAQTVWIDFQNIAREVELVVEKQIKSDGSIVLGDGQTERILQDLAIHNLYFDDMLMNASWARSAIGKQILAAWNYPELRGRLDQRIRDADALESRRLKRRTERYESTMTAVLFALSLASAVELTLSLFALSVTEAPARSIPSAAMTVIRAVGIDAWLALTCLALLLATHLVYGRHRDRRRARPEKEEAR